MKKEIHPKYQKVLFVDSASGYRFVCGSTLQTDAKEVFEGKEYPVSYLSISSASHPFFTGSKQLVDSEGRVEKFKKRFGAIGSSSEFKEGSEQQQQQQQQPKKQEQPKKAESKPAQANAKAPVKAPVKAPAKAPEKKGAANDKKAPAKEVAKKK